MTQPVQPSSAGMLSTPMPGLDDPEGLGVPTDLSTVVDAHVHLFPDRVFQAIWRWFDQHGWPIRYKLTSEEVLGFLRERGVRRLVGLSYAHKPGLAVTLNRYMTDLVERHDELTGLATVLPGEPGAANILREAFAAGLRGVKIHCHVQCVAPDDPAMDEVYRACCDANLPLVMHAGREPKSPGYRCDPHALCSAERVAVVLEKWPELTLVIPHLGADEFAEFAALLEQHENLWLDTTMMLAGYFPGPVPWEVVEQHGTRLLYGSDFPNLPYAWDRELKAIAARQLPAATLTSLLSGNAERLFGMAHR